MQRPDFQVAEMAGGVDLYFAQNDNRSTGDVVYRMRVREIDPDQLVVGDGERQRGALPGSRSPRGGLLVIVLP